MIAEKIAAIGFTPAAAETGSKMSVTAVKIFVIDARTSGIGGKTGEIGAGRDAPARGTPHALHC